MKLYRYLIVLVLLSAVFSSKIRHKSAHRSHASKQDGIDWSKNTVGSHSDQVGVLEPTEGQLTTNWNELVNDHSKKMISLGLPNDVDMNKHIAIGSNYEDVVYVKSDKKETKQEVIDNMQETSRFNKATKTEAKSKNLVETETPEEQALEDLVAIEFDRDEQDAAQAFNNLMRHQDQILAFLDSIEHVQYLSAHQQVVVNQLAKYIKLLTGAHEDLKAEETEDDVEFIQEIATRIRQYTFGVDSQSYNTHAADMQQNNIPPQHQRSHDRIVRQLHHTEEHLLNNLDKGEVYIEEDLRQAEKLENESQKASKVLQTNYVIDEIRRLSVVRDGPAMIQLASEFKKFIRAEIDTLGLIQSNLEQFEQALQDVPEPEQATVEDWLKQPQWYINEKQTANLKLIAHSLSIEDEHTAAKTLEMVKDSLRNKISLCASTASLVHKQFESAMTLEDLVNANDMAGCEDVMTHIADDTFDNQKLVVANPEIAKKAFNLRESIRDGHLVEAKNQAKTVISIVNSQEYPKPSHGALDSTAKSTTEQQDRDHTYNAIGLDQLLKETLADVQSENFQGADERIERLADRAQQVAKITKVQNTIKQFQEDPAKGAAGCVELKKVQQLEATNLQQDQVEMQACAAKVSELQNTINSESFNQSSKKVADIIAHENINSEAKWSLMYAKKYIDQDDAAIAHRHLVHAVNFLQMDQNSIQRSIDSMMRQQDILDKAIHLGDKGDQHVASSYLQQIIDEVNQYQHVCEIDENIENHAQNAKEALDEGDVDKATLEINEMVANLNDVYGAQRKRDTDYPRILIQDEERGSYVDGHQGEDIREVNLSVDQVNTARELTDVEKLVTLVNQNLEEMTLNTQDKGWQTQPHKLEAERQLERLYKLAQEDYKVIDFRSTLDKVNNVLESNSDSSELVEACKDLKQSNDEEKLRLETMETSLRALQSEVEGGLQQLDQDEKSNQEAAAVIRGLVSHEYANVVTMQAIQDADRFLESNKHVDAKKRLNDAIQNLVSQSMDVATSLHAIQQQNDGIAEAEAQCADDVPKCRDTLKALAKKVVAQQKIILTDEECTNTFNHIRQLIYEGKPGEAAQQVNALGEALANELKAQKDSQHRSPDASPSEEVQEAEGEALEKTVLNAENSIEGDNKIEAKQAVEQVHDDAQESAKVKLVEEAKEEVKEALDQQDNDSAVEVLENLEENLENEENQLQEQEQAIEDTKEAVEKAQDEDSNQEEATEDAEQLEQEVAENNEIPTEIEEQIKDAEEAAQDGDLKEYAENLEKAEESLEEEQDHIKKSEEAVESQLDDVKEAIDAVKEGDEGVALKELSDVEESVKQDQPVVRVSDEATEAAEGAKQAIEAGADEAAVDQVEDIVSEADDSADEEQVAPEEEQEQSFAEAVEALSDALQPEDPAEINPEELMGLFEQASSADVNEEYKEQLEQVDQALVAQDYETAVALLEEILENVKPEEEIEEAEEPAAEEKKTKKQAKKMVVKKAKVARKAEKKVEKKTEKKVEKKEAKQMRKSKKETKKVVIKKTEQVQSPIKAKKSNFRR